MAALEPALGTTSVIAQTGQSGDRGPIRIDAKHKGDARVAA